MSILEESDAPRGARGKNGRCCAIITLHAGHDFVNYASRRGRHRGPLGQRNSAPWRIADRRSIRIALPRAKTRRKQISPRYSPRNLYAHAIHLINRRVRTHARMPDGPLYTPKVTVTSAATRAWDGSGRREGENGETPCFDPNALRGNDVSGSHSVFYPWPLLRRVRLETPRVIVVIVAAEFSSSFRARPPAFPPVLSSDRKRIRACTYFFVRILPGLRADPRIPNNEDRRIAATMQPAVERNDAIFHRAEIIIADSNIETN